MMGPTEHGSSAKWLVLGVLLFGGMCISCKSNSTANRQPGGPVTYSVEPAFPSLTFTYPVDLEASPDRTNRLFVVEQAGRIVVFVNTPTAQSAKVFLDIRAKVRSGGEMGLLGLAFHPQYTTNGYLYVNYDADSPLRTVIARFTVSRANPDSVDPASETILLEYLQPYTNHKGGQIRFGPDGYLYIGAGDGGSGGDPHNNAQNLGELLGKILRIDVNATAQGLNYGIPPDNPFVGTAGRPEIWAYGLRNPWRFSFDPPTGLLWVADVGQDAIEEVDIVHRGGNYGWRIMEGRSCYNPSSGCDTTGLEMPVWQYHHDVGNCIIGGYVYRGNALPSLSGAYVYADFGSGRIWALRSIGTGSPVNEEILHTKLAISSFGVDQQQELYLCGYDGVIYHLTQ